MAATLLSFQYIEEEQSFKVSILNLFTGQPQLIETSLEVLKSDSEVIKAFEALQTYAQTLADNFDYKAQNEEIQATINKKQDEIAALQAIIK